MSFELRSVDQPFSVDRLPPVVHRAIQDLYTRHGLTWKEIEELSAQPFDQRWDDEPSEDEDGNVTLTRPAFKVDPTRGFVNWDKLPSKTLELFPDLRIPKSNLHRWYRARVVQVQQQLRESAERAREIAQAFAGAVIEGSNEAVLNAARDQLMVVLSEDGTAKGRMAAAKALTSLAEVMQTARANDIKERKVAVDERKMAQMEREAEARRKRMEAETETLAKKVKNGEVSLDDVNAIRRKTFGLPPIDSEGKVVAA